MARQTRQQRRARREEQATTAQPPASTTARARARQQQVRPAAQPPKSQGGTRREPAGGGSRRFIAESWGELKKVEWPGRNQVIQATTVVLIACLVVGVFLFLSDLAFKHLVQNVLLGQ